MTDEQLLIDRAQQGDREAFRHLVERSNADVYRLAYDMTRNRHDAEDLSQEVFIRAHRSLANFRREAKWSTWLYRITVNLCLDHRDKQSRKRMEYRDDTGYEDQADGSSRREARNSGAASSPATSSPDRETESVMIQQHIEQALSRLPAQERAVFSLRHYHDLPLKEIADTMNIAEGTVKSHLFRALQRLRRELAFYKKEIGPEG
ncbi:MAG: sigma-70 family RNA polymerase sigma factor [Ignavibacteria bacterium]|nr:MAG: sigma-70 family RNA polymerase sigma factor [Ignavibacteria bacterium]